MLLICLLNHFKNVFIQLDIIVRQPFIKFRPAIVVQTWVHF